VQYVVTAADLNVERAWVASLDNTGALSLYVDGALVTRAVGPAISDWAGGNSGGYWARSSTVLTEEFGSGSGAVGPTAAEATVNTTKGLRLYEDLIIENVAPTHSWIAGANDDISGDATWHEFAGGTNITLSSGTETLSATGIAAAPFAYDSPAGNNGVNSSTEFGGTGDVSFEIILRVDDLSGTEMIWEVGGSGSGSSLLIDDSTLQLSSQTGSSANRMTVQTTLDNDHVGSWLHIVGVITESGAGDDTLELFVNGQSAGSDSIADDSFTNWAGNSPWGLGTIGNNYGGEPASTTPANFTGDIALFNHYAIALSSAQVLDQARSFGIPTPAALPAGLALLGMVALKRRK